MKRMVQFRQLSHTHPDDHYAAKFRNVASFVCQNDKHVIKIGETDYSVAAVDLGKSVLVGKDVSFSVGDDDFTHLWVL